MEKTEAGSQVYELKDLSASNVIALRFFSRIFPVKPGKSDCVTEPHNSAHAPIFSGRSLPKTPRDFNLRCRAERSMPTNAAVREILPPKRVTWAIKYSRSKTSRASRSGRVMI